MKTAQKKMKAVSAEEWSRRLALFHRQDTPGRSTIICLCGTSFSWEGIDNGLHPWIEEHVGHVTPKPGARRTMIDDTMAATKMMAGACWPSADAMRWGLERLARQLADKASSLALGRRTPAQIRDLLLEACGLPEKKGRS